MINSKIDEQKAEIMKLEYKNALSDTKINQRNKFIILLFFFIITLLLMIVYIYFQNRKIAKLNKNLNESNNTILKFFSIISHDLRSPVGAFKMIIQELNQNYDYFSEQDKKQLIFESGKEVNNIYNLLENLLTWAKTNRGEFNLKFEEVINISNELDEIIKQNNLQLKTKELKIEKNYEADLIIETDRDMFNTIIRNLLSNAIKFSLVGKSIEIKINKFSDRIELDIIDQGIGMPSVIKDNLFKIDKKISRSGTMKESGTGLGLIIVSEFLSSLKGTIKVNSEENQGTEFKVILPLS